MTTNNVCCFLFSGFCDLLAVLGCPHSLKVVNAIKGFNDVATKK